MNFSEALFVKIRKYQTKDLKQIWNLHNLALVAALEHRGHFWKEIKRIFFREKGIKIKDCFIS